MNGLVELELTAFQDLLSLFDISDFMYDNQKLYFIR